MIARETEAQGSKAPYFTCLIKAHTNPLSLNSLKLCTLTNSKVSTNISGEAQSGTHMVNPQTSGWFQRPLPFSRTCKGARGLWTVLFSTALPPPPTICPAYIDDQPSHLKPSLRRAVLAWE